MDGDWKIPLIIGCSVGGFLLILAVLIVAIYLRRRSRQRKNQCYDSNLSSRDATVDSGYTTFSLQKPGMPPLPSSGQSHPHGGLWTTQAVSQAQQQWAQPTVTVEGISQTDKKTSSSSSLAHKSTEDVHKQSNGFWKDRKSSSHMHESTESMESTTGSSTGSYGSQSELILRDHQKAEAKSKSRERKRSQRRSERLEPDMSVIEEESNPGSKIGQYKGLPPTSEPEVPHHHQAIQVRHNQPDELEHPPPPPAVAVAAVASEVDSRRTIYPPPPTPSPAAAVNVDAIIEIQPKPPASRTISVSEDKRLILEAFSFLDEFDQQE